jgi:hypothetical protein
MDVNQALGRGSLFGTLTFDALSFEQSGQMLDVLFYALSVDRDEPFQLAHLSIGGDRQVIKIIGVD